MYSFFVKTPPSSKTLVSNFGFRKDIPPQFIHFKDLFLCFLDSNNFSLKFCKLEFELLDTWIFLSLQESCVHKPFPILAISSPTLMMLPHF